MIRNLQLGSSWFKDKVKMTLDFCENRIFAEVEVVQILFIFVFYSYICFWFNNLSECFLLRFLLNLFVKKLICFIEIYCTNIIAASLKYNKVVYNKINQHSPFKRFTATLCSSPFLPNFSWCTWKYGSLLHTSLGI